MEQEIQVNNSHRGQGKARADIVIWKSASAKIEESSATIVVECKAEHITIREEDYFQGYNYAAWAGADFFVTTNLKETRVFKVNKSKLPKRLEEIADIPKAEEISNIKKIKELLSQTKAFTRDEFSKLLFKCHNIIRNNDKLSPEAAFDEISKVLFIKIRYERDNTGTQIFSEKEFKKLREAYDKTKSKQSLPFYQQLFERTKEDYIKDDLFEPNDTIKIKEASFEAIVKELEVYNLSQFLKRNKMAISIQDGILYKRVTIRVRNGGVVTRDEVIGENIGTKKQFLVSEGQFIISKIDARNGAMGIVPKELNNAVVTQDFLSYGIDTTKVNPQYFVLVCTTKQFMEFCQSCSSGTTNRQRIDEKLFLNIKIPVPSIEEQNKLIEEYNAVILKVQNSDNKIDSLKKDIDQYISTALGYTSINVNFKHSKELLSTYKFKDLKRWDIFNLNYEVQSYLYKTIPLNDLIIGKPKYGASYKTIHKVSDVRYIRITDINEDGTLNDDAVSADGFDSQYLLQNNDFLIARSGNTVGKTFLDSKDVGKAIFAGYLIKFVLNTNIVNPKYLLYEILNIQKVD